MTNRKLRKKLLEKLGITPQALSYQVKRLKQKFPMTTEDATYVIAQKNGIILDRYLDRATVDRVRGLLPDTSGSVRTDTERRPTKKPPQKETQRTIVIGKEFKGTDPILSSTVLAEAKEMAGIYPYLYVLENSIRALIQRVMKASFGDNWWDSQAPKGLRHTVAERMHDEHRNSWHQRRGVHPIDYLDLNQLPALARKIGQNLFPSILPSIEWFNQLIDEVYKSRCVVCHMNPLDKDNIQSIKLKFNQWQRQINAKIALIP